MKNVSLILISSLFFGCANAKNPTQREMTIRPGEVRLVEFDIPSSDAQLYCRGRENKLHKTDKKALAIIIESYFSDLSPFSCSLKVGDQVVEYIHFKVEEREYKAEKLKVDPKKIKLSAKDQRRADAEQLILNKVYANSESSFLFNEPFIQPMNSHVTSYYGTKRVYNKQKKSQHLGTDYRAAIGEKIPAANRGRVVFAGDIFFTGWTIIIDHGMDIFTVYGHCSKALVKEGDIVERGQLIALSGNTGRTSGPHLHWGVKIQGQYLDGFVLIEETKKIFKE